MYTEKQGDIEKTTIYRNGKLNRKFESTKDYYCNVTYDENGKIEEEQRIDKHNDVMISYKDGKILKKVITKGEEETTISYDENEKEEGRTTRKIVKTPNMFEMLQDEKLRKERLTKEARKKQKEEIVNHGIVAIDIQEDKLTLLIDPTNPSIGIYKDGKIKMFNETKPDEVIQDRSIIGDAYNKGFEGIIDYPIDYIKSFIEPTLSLEEIEEKYGLYAQNKMLEKIEKEDEKTTFRKGLKIDKGITYDFDTNIVTIVAPIKEETVEAHDDFDTNTVTIDEGERDK